jgi:F-type H+-transporting ATPase subunit delta
VAKRYAKALFALAREEACEEAWGAELARVASVFAERPLASVVRDATVDRRTKRELARRVAEELGLSRPVANFVGLLAERNRLQWLSAIEGHYGRLLDEALGRVRARIVAARPVPDERLQRIVAALARRTGKTVLAETAVDPHLLGGVLVEIGGRVYDGTLRARLEAIRQALAG